MTVDELITKLHNLSTEGYGGIKVVIGEVGTVSNIVNVQKQTLYCGGYKFPHIEEVICLYHN